MPVQLHFTAHDGAPVQLQADDGTHTVSVTAQPPERAQKRETTAADVENALRRMGGTVFTAEHVTVELDGGLRIAAKQLNDLRRQALAALTQARMAVPPVREHTHIAQRLAKNTPFSGYTVQVRTLAQLTDDMAALPVQAFYVPAQQFAGHPARAAQLMSLGCTLVPVLPRIVWDREQAEVLRQLEACKTLGCTAALCGNLAQVALVQRVGLTAYGDFGLNAYNAASLDALHDMGVQRQTLSFELRLPQIRDMRKPLDTELIVCGRLPLMLTENCMIAGAKGGCKRDGTGICAKGAYYLTDRKGARFPVFREEHCRNSLYNSQPLYLEQNEYRQTGVTYARLLFTDESPRVALHIAQAVLDGRQPELGVPVTRGLYRRGVE